MEKRQLVYLTWLRNWNSPHRPSIRERRPCSKEKTGANNASNTSRVQSGILQSARNNLSKPDHSYVTRLELPLQDSVFLGSPFERVLRDANFLLHASDIVCHLEEASKCAWWDEVLGG